MVNSVEALKPLLHGLIKLAGLRQRTVELDTDTTMNFWVPKKSRKQKPAVVLVHGFAAEGLVTWQFQIGNLTKKYAVYVPDLVFFGDSKTVSAERSPGFQAECLARALGMLGVERYTVVGFSYGGMVAFKLLEARPETVTAMVVSGSVVAMTDSIGEEALERLGFKSSAELLMPETGKDCKTLLSLATHRKLWFPDCIYRDFVEAMINNRKERAELLEGLVVCNRDATIPTNLPQRILFLWGENDRIFDFALAKNMKEQMGDRATLQGIPKAGHLVHLERPCVYNRRLKEFLSLVHNPDDVAKH